MTEIGQDKSAVLLWNMPKCPLCGSYLELEKSIKRHQMTMSCQNNRIANSSNEDPGEGPSSARNEGSQSQTSSSSSLFSSGSNSSVSSAHAAGSVKKVLSDAVEESKKLFMTAAGSKVKQLGGKLRGPRR